LDDAIIEYPQEKIRLELNKEDKCDILIRRDGEEIATKIMEVGVNEIKYKKCNNLDGPTYSILKRDVFMIKYSNGSKDLFKEEPVKRVYEEKPSQTNYGSQQKQRAHAGGVTGLVFGSVGLSFGIVLGYLFSVFFGLFWILGIPAFILGIVAVSAKRRRPEKYKGKAAGVLAIIFGIICIALLIIFTVALF
jgi:hypothetical protein